MLALFEGQGPGAKERNEEDLEDLPIVQVAQPKVTAPRSPKTSLFPSPLEHQREENIQRALHHPDRRGYQNQMGADL